MATTGGPNIVTDGLVFGYDTGFPSANNDTPLRFYNGEPTVNKITDDITASGIDGSGQSSIGTRVVLGTQHIRITDVASNSRQSTLVQGLTGGANYTVSIQYKKIAGAPTFRFQLQNYNGSSYVSTIAFPTTVQIGLVDVSGWQTATYSFTLASGANGMRVWYQDGNDYTTYTHIYEIKNPQLEQNSHRTPYTAAADVRSVSGSLMDLAGISDIDVSNISFDSTAHPTFDGTDDKLTISNNNQVAFGSGDFTLEVVTKPTSFSTYTHLVSLPLQSTFSLKATKHDGNLYFYSPSFTTFGSTDGWNLTLNEWNSVVLVRKSGVAYCYLNGTLIGTKSGFNNILTAQDMNIGWGWGSEYTPQSIPIVRVYNVGLTDDEVEQNFNAYKHRFGI